MHSILHAMIGEIVGVKNDTADSTTTRLDSSTPRLLDSSTRLLDSSTLTTTTTTTTTTRCDVTFLFCRAGSSRRGTEETRTYAF